MTLFCIVITSYSIHYTKLYDNRFFALPAKLGEMGVINISKGMGATLDTIGIWAFFIVIGGFGTWVIGTFLKNIGQLKGEGEHV